MKIVLYVDFGNCNFNKDFELSSMLLSRGHNVFLASNLNQLEYLATKCDRVVCGYSGKENKLSITFLSSEMPLNSAIETIEK